MCFINDRNKDQFHGHEYQTFEGRMFKKMGTDFLLQNSVGN